MSLKDEPLFYRFAEVFPVGLASQQHNRPQGRELDLAIAEIGLFEPIPKFPSPAAVYGQHHEF
jgi:hypothetical protein